MAHPERRVVPALLEVVVQAAVDEHLDPGLGGELVRARGPEHLGHLAAVEAVDIDKGAPGAPEQRAEVRLGRKCALDRLDIGIAGPELLESTARGVAGQDAQRVRAGPGQLADDGDALGSRAAHDGYETLFDAHVL